MLNNDAVTMDEITNIWIEITGDLNTPVDRKLFGRLNIALDDYIEEKEESMDDDGNNVDEEEDDDDDVEEDIYDPKVDPRLFYDEESLVEITKFFTTHADNGGSLTNGKLSYSTFLEWDDILALKNEGPLDDDDINMAWGMASNGELLINYDQFLRLNVQLDLIMDEYEEEEEEGNDDDDDDEDAESFYRSEFITMTGNAGSTMTLSMLLEWKEIKDLIEDGVVTKKQITKMFESIPKAKGSLTDGTSGKSKKATSTGTGTSSEGISQDAFVEFNGMLDEVLEQLAGN